MHTHMHAYTNMNTYANTHTCTHTYTHAAHAHTHTYKHKRARIHPGVRTHIHTHTPDAFFDAMWPRGRGGGSKRLGSTITSVGFTHVLTAWVGMTGALRRREAMALGSAEKKPYV